MTDLEICQLALIKIGGVPIQSLDDGTVEAAVCSRVYPLVRDALLAGYGWRWATKSVALAPLAAELDDSGWEYQYQLPADCLRVLRAGSGDPAHKGGDCAYTVQGTMLLSDDDDTVVTYLARMPEHEFPVYFLDALVARVAADINTAITENAGRSLELLKIAEMSFRQAKRADALQGFERQPHDLIASRYAAAGGFWSR